MVKSWLTQIVRKIREAAPAECKAIDFPLEVEVTGNESSRWIVSLSDGRVDTRTKEEVKLTIFVPQTHLRVLSMKLRYAAWKEAFDAQIVRIHAEDPKLPEKLQPIAKAAEKAAV